VTPSSHLERFPDSKFSEKITAPLEGREVVSVGVGTGMLTVEVATGAGVGVIVGLATSAGVAAGAGLSAGVGAIVAGALGMVTAGLTAATLLDARVVVGVVDTSDVDDEGAVIDAALGVNLRLVGAEAVDELVADVVVVAGTEATVVVGDVLVVDDGDAAVVLGGVEMMAGVVSTEVLELVEAVVTCGTGVGGKVVFGDGLRQLIRWSLTTNWSTHWY
jgi:hypothetical protein